MKRAPESVNGFKRFAAIAALAGIAVVAPSAHADQLATIREVKLGYTLYLGGLHVMNATTDFARDGMTYNVQMKAGTQGFLRSMAPWDADVTTKGKWGEQALQPETSTVMTRWQDDEKKVILAFRDGKRVETRFEPPEGENKHEDVPDDLLNGALDPLSGIVQIMASFAYGKGCAQTVPIFDGHRRFDLVLTDRGSKVLEGGDYSIYSGNATKCEVDLEMRAGSRKDREGSRFWEDAKGGNRPPVYVYLAKVRDDLPAIPVRAETSTPFGSVLIHLKNIEGKTVQNAGLN